MLYDPKWNQKADPYKLENLIAWLEQRNPSEGYRATDLERCLLGQYSAAMGADDPRRGSLELEQVKSFQDVAFGGARTFGAALERARAAHNRTEK